jgi:hypothetical protein
MLTKATPSTVVGLSYHDVNFMFDSATTYLTVADETNQNLTSPQKELMLWHWRLVHINFEWVQMLTAQPRDKAFLPSINTKQPTVSWCPIPLCMACQMAKQARRTPDIARMITDTTKEMMTKRYNLRPGQKVSLDQYMGLIPGRLPHTKGKELEKDHYTGGTIFVDHASVFIYVRNQVSLHAGETIVSKKLFETLAQSYGVTIESYLADNVPFNSREFTQDLHSKGQKIDLSDVGAHHQNGVAERAIKTVTSLARVMLLHMAFH